MQEKYGKRIHNNNGYIICINNEKIGYIQTYNARDFAAESNLDLSSIAGSVCGVDLFIGNSGLLHKAIGPQILNEFEKQILAPNFDYCLVDPAKNNKAAIKAFEKAGFEMSEQFISHSNIWMIKKLPHTEKDNNLFIVILRYKVPLEKIDSFRAAHLEFLQNYYNQDLFITSGPQVPRDGGIILAKCSSKEALSAILSDDPFAINDLATYEIIEFKPTKSSNEFEKVLFDQSTSILEELKSREPIFHHPEKFGKTRKDLEDQICDEFWEVGASGKIYTKHDVIETLLKRYNNPNYQDICEASDFKVTQISLNNYLLTYTLIQNYSRYTRRATIWRKINSTWKILYHHGTIIGDNE